MKPISATSQMFSRPVPAYTAAMISTVSPGTGTPKSSRKISAEREVPEAIERRLQAVQDTRQVRWRRGGS